jgi:cytochrome oxidase Cu insertion factor (SCO1/SenC/PrrC family)
MITNGGSLSYFAQINDEINRLYVDNTYTQNHISDTSNNFYLVESNGDIYQYYNGSSSTFTYIEAYGYNSTSYYFLE